MAKKGTGKGKGTKAKATKYEQKVYNKADLIERMAEGAGISKAEAERQLNNTLAGIESVVGDFKGDFVTNEAGTKTTYKGDKLQLVGFMTIERAHRAGRKGHNPRDPENKLDIPAKDYVKVKVGTGLDSELK